MGREILRATNLQKLITEYAKLASILSWDTFVAEIKALPTTKSCIAEYALRLGGGGVIVHKLRAEALKHLPQNEQNTRQAWLRTDLAWPARAFCNGCAINAHKDV
jgi:hypothetical protein